MRGKSYLMLFCATSVFALSLGRAAAGAAANSDRAYPFELDLEITLDVSIEKALPDGAKSIHIVELDSARSGFDCGDCTDLGITLKGRFLSDYITGYAIHILLLDKEGGICGAAAGTPASRFPPKASDAMEEFEMLLEFGLTESEVDRVKSFRVAIVRTPRANSDEKSERDFKEAAAFRGSERRAWREGNLLLLRFVGRQRIYRDWIRGGVAEWYRYVERMKPIPYHLIEVGYYEDVEYLMVHADSGVETVIYAPPKLSPDATRFALTTQGGSFGLGGSNGIEIWSVTASGLAREWEIRAEHWWPSDAVWTGPTELSFKQWTLPQSGDSRPPPTNQAVKFEDGVWRCSVQP